jgi:A/G-specific adenine glycosylase
MPKEKNRSFHALEVVMPAQNDKSHQLVERWFEKNQRNLPWRQNRDPYRVWLSEIMLQQTQVSVVVDYFNRFIEAFPSIDSLSKASEEQVLALWSGLGYYSRGRNLRKTAQIIAQEHYNIFPNDYDTLLRLPGIGSYTAGAILTFAFQKPAAVVDGNIARVLARLFNDQTEINSVIGKKHFEAISLQLVQKADSVLLWQEGLMELGALICKTKNPLCTMCPLQNNCLSRKKNTISEIPKKIAPKKRQSLSVIFAIIHNHEKIWLERNTNTNLFKGLYAPPNAYFTDADRAPKIVFDLLKNRGISHPLHQLKPVHIQRTLTHKDLHLFGFSIDLKAEESKTDFCFKIEQLNKMAIPTAIKILIECILDKKADVL